MATWDVGAIERAFVEAAVDPSRWNAAMEATAQLTGAAGAALLPIRGRLPLMPHSKSMANGFEVYLRDGWIERDERYRALPAMLRKGVACDFDFTTPEEMKRNPYYQEFLAPLGHDWCGLALIAAAENQWTLSLQHSFTQGPFQQHELDELVILSRHLSSAAALARAIGFAAVSGAVEAFERSGTAVVQLDLVGEIIHMNAAAECLIGSGIRVVNKRLVADHTDATRSLDRALHTLLWAGTNATMPPVPLPRADRRPLLAYPLSLAAVADNPFAQCRSIIVLIDPERKDRPPESVLRGAFGLTPAEAKLAALLARGEAVEQAADAFGVAKETARNQLKSIFAKTGVHRQAELVALIAGLLGQFFGGA